MKTTHQLAAELMELPDVPVLVNGWILIDNFEVTARMSEYDPSGTAFIVQAPKESSQT